MQVIKLSDAVQSLARQTTQFVHGVPESFLSVGEQKAQPPAEGEPRFSRGAYFIGKVSRLAAAAKGLRFRALAAVRLWLCSWRPHRSRSSCWTRQLRGLPASFSQPSTTSCHQQRQAAMAKSCTELQDLLCIARALASRCHCHVQRLILKLHFTVQAALT